MALDRAGDYYMRHVGAMTAEGLHSKSEIAAELAWRDLMIDTLEAEIAELRSGKGLHGIFCQCEACEARNHETRR